MKRFTTLTLATAVALASLGTTAAMAQPYQPPGPGYDHHDHGPGYGPSHQWRHGDRFYGDRTRVDWRYHHLRPPPRGYEWVQDHGQFLLIGIASGVVADVLINR